MSSAAQLEDQIVVRFPPDIAEKLQKALDEQQGKDLECKVSIRQSLQRVDGVEEVAFALKVDGKDHKATLVDLPCVLETYKTIDFINIFKSGDVSQMLYVHRDGEESVPGDVAKAKVVEAQSCTNDASLGGSSNVLQQDSGASGQATSKRLLRKYYAHHGVTEPLRFVRQRFFRKMPKIARSIIVEHEKKLESIQKELQQMVTGREASPSRQGMRKRKYKRIIDVKNVW